MKQENNQLTYSPSDLSNHIGCSHLTELNKRLARGEIGAPQKYPNPSLDALIEKGKAFEQEHLKELRARGLGLCEIEFGSAEAEEKTLAAMANGVDVIYQARLVSGKWSGWADFLVKVDRPSNLGKWSYQVVDTKLATNTRAATILQIGLYSQRVSEIQSVDPEFMGVKKPNGEEWFRYDDFAAYVRLAQARFERALEEDSDTYPEPVAHCDICRWWKQCNSKRREDDHLTFVAGMGKAQIVELRNQGIDTLEKLAKEPGPVSFTPKRGKAATYNKLRDQAELQFRSRNENFKPLHELLPIEEGKGLFLLPEPNEHDVFLDLEGARMVEPDGLEYLIGYFYKGEYTALWATNEEKELENFQTFMDWVTELKNSHPELHIYHYAPYEPSAFKRLMGKYASRENEVDTLLRSEAFVDLYKVLRQSLIASVERYSLKDLEKFFGYERKMDLRQVSAPKSSFEYLLEIKEPERALHQDLEIIEAYNKDDCHALIKLQEWLESQRTALRSLGNHIPRPEFKDGGANEKITEHQQRILPLFEALLAEVPAALEDRSREEQGRYILAHFLDWYRREEKSLWWELYRLRDLELDELIEERTAISYLRFTGKRYQEKRSIVDVYSFPPQEVKVATGDVLNQLGKKIGILHSIDKVKGELHVKKGPKFQDLEHPSAVIVIERIRFQKKEESIIRIANWIVDNGITSADTKYAVGRKMLIKKPPRLSVMGDDQSSIGFAIEALAALRSDFLAVQGPPGAGKSYIGSRLILDLVRKGRRVGVTALTHKVITNLLMKTFELAQDEDFHIRILQRTKEDVLWSSAANDEEVRDSLEAYNIIAGTSFMWSDERFFESVDYMFVDEAGQLALIDTVAMSQAAKNLVLLGDPNQLQQPQQGVHPSGSEASALEHILDGHQVIQRNQGIFLETTWRMHPEINAIVSELFYQNRLKAESHLVNQRIIGSEQYDVGLRLIELSHEGNTTSSTEEVEFIRGLVEALCNRDLKYVSATGEEEVITPGAIKIISPYNAQVNLLKDSMPGVEIGTVDKFQGQEAPIVIYSVACSSPSDAPRGMEFLYSPNRLNVAISRAKALFIMVASPEIFLADCKSPREMKLANAFCRFKELAKQDVEDKN